MLLRDKILLIVKKDKIFYKFALNSIKIQDKADLMAIW